MKRPRTHQDIQPLSQFRAKVAFFIQRVQSFKRPLIITHRGRGAVVMLGVLEYEQLLDQLELLQDIQTADEQIQQGRGVSHAEAKRKVLSALK